MINFNEWDAISDLWISLMVFKVLFCVVSLSLCLIARKSAATARFGSVAFVSLIFSGMLFVNLGLPYEMSTYDVFRTLSYDLAMLVAWASIVGVILFPPRISGGGAARFS